MSRLLRSTGLAAVLLVTIISSRVLAENEGQADLDKATQLKIDATTGSDLGEVISLCEKAIEKGLDKNSLPFANNLLASTLVQRGSLIANKAMTSLSSDGDWKQYRKLALADLEKGLSINPKQPQASFLIARLDFLPGGDTKRATELLDEAVAQSDDDPPLKAEALFLRSQTRKDPALRLADLNEAVTAAPGDAAALRARGAVLADMDRFKDALVDLDKSIEADPKQPATYLLKAMVLVKQQKPDMALGILETGRLAVPKSIDLPLNKARIYLSQSNLKSALVELDRACDIDPSNLTALALRAAVHQDSGDKEKALGDVDRILKINPGLTEDMRNRVMRDRAGLLAELSKFTEAIEQLEKLRATSPKDEAILFQLGLIYTATKEYRKAVEAYTALLSDHPDEWSAYRGRGDAELNMGQRVEAVADYDQALRRKPQDVGILNNLSWVLATAPEENLRDGKRALVLATEACKLTEYKQDYILSTLASAYAETGDYENAKKWAAKSVELSTKEHVEETQKELDSYKAGKPWREALPAPDEKPLDEKKPADNKPAAKKKSDEKKSDAKIDDTTAEK